MKSIRTILKYFRLFVLLPSLTVGLGWVFLASCTGRPTLADVAEEDSLFIDTVATLDEKMAPDTLSQDSLILDSL